MGCPDWPKCFGTWIPPTDVSQLPADYQEQYKDHGYGDMAFNVLKTWTEYLNRLLGVIVGLMVVLTFGASIPFFKIDKRIFYLSLAALVMILIQGFLGALVVRTNLHTGMITVHMVVALLIVALLIAAFMGVYAPVLRDDIAGIPAGKRALLKKLGAAVMLLLLVQIILGTQVRERVDEVMVELGAESDRTGWMSRLGTVYSIHRVFYYLLTAIIVWWVVRLKDFFAQVPAIRKWAIAMIAVLLVEVVLGIVLNHFALPPAIQPAHLLFASLLFSISFTLNGILYVSK
jgi:cytochrome c oxidase assembly protein subunit 15